MNIYVYDSKISLMASIMDIGYVVWDAWASVGWSPHYFSNVFNVEPASLVSNSPRNKKYKILKKLSKNLITAIIFIE